MLSFGAYIYLKSPGGAEVIGGGVSTVNFYGVRALDSISGHLFFNFLLSMGFICLFYFLALMFLLLPSLSP